MNFMRRGSKWYVFFRIAGKQFSLSTGESDIEAARIQGARIFLAHVEREHSGEVTSVDDSIELYWRWHGHPTGSNKPQASSARKYEGCLRRVCALVGAKDIPSLAKAATTMTAGNLGVTESNFTSLVRQAAGMFNREFLKWAESVGKRLSNPFAGCVPPVPLQKQFIAPPTAKILALNAAAELGLARNELLLFKLCLGAGLRIGEATHLTWANVLERSIFVESTSMRKTKSGKSREIPVSSTLLQFLELHRGLPNHYVVADEAPPKESKYGRPLRRCDRAVKRLSKWLKHHGVTDPRPQHWLRKVFASVVTDQHGIHVASRWLGHSSIAITERVYSGVASDLHAAVV